jgi:hypothetical protein
VVLLRWPVYLPGLLVSWCTGKSGLEPKNPVYPVILSEKVYVIQPDSVVFVVSGK